MVYMRWKLALKHDLQALLSGILYKVRDIRIAQLKIHRPTITESLGNGPKYVKQPYSS